MNFIKAQNSYDAQGHTSTSKARHVKIYLVDGEPEGIRNAQIDISMTLAIAFKGDQLNLGVKKEYGNKIQKPGVYLVIGADPSNPDKRLVYIGESEEVGRRLNFHKGIIKGNASDIDKSVGLTFWEDTLVFVSEKDYLTKSHIRYVEAELIAAAGGKNGWSIFNKKKPPAKGKLPKEDASAMNKFIEEIKILTGALGFDLFKINKLPPPAMAVGVAAAAESENPEFTFSGAGFNAKAVFLGGSTGEWVVRASSVAKLDPSPATPKGAAKLRSQLEADGVLKKTSNGLEFTTDFAFPSASAAACVISGTSVAGPTAWKKNGKTYKEWETELSGEVAQPAHDLLTVV